MVATGSWLTVARTEFLPKSLWAAVVCTGLFTATNAVTSRAAAVPSDAEVEGFTEPYRTIHVASEEMGTIEEVEVREGETVTAGRPLARLDNTVHLAHLAIARQNMRSEGRLDAAQADLRLKRDRLNKLESLCTDGHARQEEVDRANMEVRIAEANLRAAQEELVARRLEYERIEAQIATRTVCAPVDGVVTKLHKQIGEFVGPNSPEIMTVVQVDRLLANFTLSNSQAAKLRLDQELEVCFDAGPPTAAVVDFISPVTNAESGTVLVKLRIDNSHERLRAGDRCRLRLAE